MSVDLWVPFAEGFHPPDRTPDRHVFEIPKSSPEFGEARLESLTTEVHRHLSSESDALVTIFAQEIGIRHPEMVAHRPLNIRHAHQTLGRRRHQCDLLANQSFIDGP